MYKTSNRVEQNMSFHRFKFFKRSDLLVCQTSSVTCTTRYMVELAYIHTHTHIYIYIYTEYMYRAVFVHVLYTV